MKSRKDVRRAVGLGGVFIRAKKPEQLSEWYRKHLGLNIEENVALFAWRARKDPKRVGHTVWSLFPENTRYFGAKNVQFMINYRVKNLNALLVQLSGEGVRLARKTENSQYGKFAWVKDPEGNRIELWEPPRAYALLRKRFLWNRTQDPPPLIVAWARFNNPPPATF